MNADEFMAQLCADAYLPGADIEIGSDLAAHVTLTPTGTFVAFRGTANAAGWLRDLDAMPKSHPLIGYCHTGFLTGACALMQKLDLPPDRPTFLTGHSLGGALAVVLGALRLAGGERVDGLCTFGAPRAGYATLAKLWHAAVGVVVMQYRFGNDPVPEVPLTLAAFPYQHVVDLSPLGAPDLAEPWRCHDIRGYRDALKGSGALPC